MKALVKQNNNLVELLEKANIKVPHFVGPKLLSFIVTVHDSKINDGNENLNNKDATVSATSIERNNDNVKNEKCNKNEQQNQIQFSSGEVLNGEKDTNVLNESNLPSNALNILTEELGEIKKFGSVDVIPVTNSSKFELKQPHKQPVKNSVEITRLVSNTEKIIASEIVASCNSSNETNYHQSNKKCSNIVAIKLDERNSDGFHINNKTNVECTDKDQINSIQSNCINNKNDKDAETDSQIKASNITPTTPMTYNIEDRRQTESNVFKNPHKTNANDSKVLSEIGNKIIEEPSKQKPTPESKDSTKFSLDNALPNQSVIASASKQINIENKESNEENTTNENEKDLTDELFESFRLPQTPNESNPNTLSPTAAFLLSFPVVSTVSNSKPTETENSFTESANILRLDEKTNQPKDHSLFESISSILNDLSDVSDAKTIQNTDITDDAQFSYCVSKNRAVAVSKTDIVDDANKNKRKTIERSYHSTQQLNSKYIQNHSQSNSDSNNKTGKCISNVKRLANTEIKKPYTSEYLSSSTSHDLAYNKQYPTLSKSSNENVTTPSTENFYVSLSTLGLPMKSAIPSSTPINSSVSSHFNFQISSLTQPRNIIESRALIADPPFTFSLTKTTETPTTAVNTMKPVGDTQSFIERNQTATSRNNSNKTKKISPIKHSTSDRYTAPTEPTVSSINRCNAYNPFAFDNPSISNVLSTSSSLALGNLITTSSSTSSMSTPFTFTLTPTFSSIPTNTSMLSNHDPLFSTSYDMPLLNSTNSISKNQSKKDKATERDYFYSPKNSKTNQAITSVSSKTGKNHVNWMTSTVNKAAQDFDFSSIPFCSTTDDNTTWSTNRIIDNTNLISSTTLPMLQGDLSLNTISSNYSNNCRHEMEATKKIHSSKSISPQKCSSKLMHNRKHEQSSQQHSSKYNKNEKSVNSYHHNYSAAGAIAPLTSSSSSSIRNNESSQSVNNFHSVSQLLDQERQISNKDNYYASNDDKLQSKEMNNNNNQHIKQKFNEKLPINTCSLGNELISSDFDKDIGVSYMFGQPKRLKLNYSSSDYLTNQNMNNYDNSIVNDIHTPYANYQTYNDNDCNTSSNSCINNLANQSFPYQYTQSQPSYHSQHQQFHTSHSTNQNTCDTIDPIISQNYFQSSTSLSNYKPPNLNDFVRNNTKPIIGQQSYTTVNSQSSKSNQLGSESKISSSHSTISGGNLSTQLSSVNKINSNRNTISASPSKPSTIHYPTHSNNFNNTINNITLNQPWNDSFSWMPYSNHTYNSNLFTNDNNSSKMNNATTNTNTIPNFNLTTIFPDCNKS